MRRILLDQSAPQGIRHILTGYDVRTAFEMGWDRLENGKLLTAAEEAGFSIMVSADQNIWHQQRLADRKIALVILTTNRWDTIRAAPDDIRGACDRAAEERYVVNLPRPPLRRPGPAATE